MIDRRLSRRLSPERGGELRGPLPSEGSWLVQKYIKMGMMMVKRCDILCLVMKKKRNRKEKDGNRYKVCIFVGMEAEKGHEIMLVGIASALHFLVDCLCVCGLYLMLYPFQLPEVVSVVVTYNVTAFLTQPITGIVADRARRPHLLQFGALSLLSCGVVMSMGTLLSSQLHTSAWSLHAVAVLLGLGNSLFHVWGGRQVAVRTRNDIRSLGVFVSTGAVGLAVGYLFYSWQLLCVLLLMLSLLSIAYVRLDGKTERVELREMMGTPLLQPLVWLAMIVLMAVVMMRSQTSERFSSGLVNGDAMVLVAGLVAMSGKMAGGWISRWMGVVKALALILVGVLVCWFFRGYGIAVLLLGVFVINCSMPITLYLANVVLKGREGLAFGLLAAALVIGLAVKN